MPPGCQLIGPTSLAYIITANYSKSDGLAGRILRSRCRWTLRVLEIEQECLDPQMFQCPELSEYFCALKRPARPSGRRTRGGHAAGAATAHRCGSTSRCGPAGSRRAPRCGRSAAPARSSVPHRSAASAAAQRQPAPQHVQHVSYQCSLCRVMHIMYMRGISQATLCCIGLVASIRS